MNCRFVQGDERDHRDWRQVTCDRCGFAMFAPHEPDRCHRSCTAWPRWHEWGHWAALVLAAVGVSPERWSWAQWKLGLVEVAEGCGGCEARKQWLNTLGGRLATSGHWLAKWLAGWVVRRVKS